MGEYSTIMARDGHEFQAWLAAAPGRPRGAVLVIQEIFGVNSHIRKVSDGFAADGYTAIAPCLFDRVRRGIERIKGAHPQAPLFVYEGAGHGFNCEQREAYNPQVAALARARTLDFFGRHVAGGEPVKG